MLNTVIVYQATLVQVMFCDLIGTKPLSCPRVTYCQLDPLNFDFRWYILKCSLQTSGYLLKPNCVKMKPALCRWQIHTTVQMDSHAWPLTHPGRVTRLCVNKPSLVRTGTWYMNQYWFTINCTQRNKIRWNWNHNETILFQVNALENVCKNAFIVFSLNVLI